MQYPVISISGAPFERGKQYGEAASDRIHKAITFYEKRFASRGVSWEDAKKRGKTFIPYIEGYLPEVLEEMRGIAEGANLSFEDILTLNCRSEILFATPDGCTCLGVPAAATTDGHVYLGQNWDNIRPVEDVIVVVKIEQPGAPRQVMCTEAGLIGGKGMNDAGLAVVLNGLSVGKGKAGVPLHVMFRAVLQQQTISNAIGVVASAKRAGSGNFFLGSAADFLMAVEFTPDNFDVIANDDETPLAHTNHYLSPIFRAEDKFKGELPCTFVRLNRIKRLIKAQGTGFNKDVIFNIFRDHSNYPDSICSHEDPVDPPITCHSTVYSVLMDLTAKKLWITDSNPCLTDAPTEITFD